jgi:hypothetical protein
MENRLNHLWICLSKTDFIMPHHCPMTVTSEKWVLQYQPCNKIRRSSNIPFKSTVHTRFIPPLSPPPSLIAIKLHVPRKKYIEPTCRVCICPKKKSVKSMSVIFNNGKQIESSLDMPVENRFYYATPLSFHPTAGLTGQTITLVGSDQILLKFLHCFRIYGSTVPFNLDYFQFWLYKCS